MLSPAYDSSTQQGKNVQHVARSVANTELITPSDTNAQQNNNSKQNPVGKIVDVRVHAETDAPNNMVSKGSVQAERLGGATSGEHYASVQDAQKHTRTSGSFSQVQQTQVDGTLSKESDGVQGECAKSAQTAVSDGSTCSTASSKIKGFGLAFYSARMMRTGRQKMIKKLGETNVQSAVITTKQTGMELATPLPQFKSFGGTDVQSTVTMSKQDDEQIGMKFATSLPQVTFGGTDVQSAVTMSMQADEQAGMKFATSLPQVAFGGTDVQSAVTMSMQADRQDGVEQAGSPSFQGSAGRGGHFGGPAASLPKVAALGGTDVQSAVTMSKQDTKAYEVDQEGRSLQASVGSGETYSASVNVTTQDVRGPIKNKHTCGLHDCHGHGHGHCHGKIVVPVQTDVVKDHG
jgi:hypothetical protein